MLTYSNKWVQVVNSKTVKSEELTGLNIIPVSTQYVFSVTVQDFHIERILLIYTKAYIMTPESRKHMTKHQKHIREISYIVHDC